MTVNLFEPFAIGKLRLCNRFVRSATHDRTADRSGNPTDESVAIYTALAQGHIGLIVTGFCFVSESGRVHPDQFGVHTDAMIPGLLRLTRSVHMNDGKIALQMVHGGFRAAPGDGSRALAVSEMPGKFAREITEADVESIIADFASAAVRAMESGFDAVQFHGAHGYLMSQFLSPALNRRTDVWGGSMENRRRFHIEAVKRVRQAVGPYFPVMIKFGVHDDREGLTLAEAVETARQMQQAGVDAIEVSAAAGLAVMPFRKGEPDRACFRESTAAVKRAVSVPVMAVCGIRSTELAQDLVDRGDADLISMSRSFIREPRLIARWEGGDRKPATCNFCNKCLKAETRSRPLECVEEWALDR